MQVDIQQLRTLAEPWMTFALTRKIYDKVMLKEDFIFLHRSIAEALRLEKHQKDLPISADRASASTARLKNFPPSANQGSRGRRSLVGVRGQSPCHQGH